MHTGMQARDVRKRLFDHPVDNGVGMVALNVGHYRQVMDDITERGSLDEEDVHGGGIIRIVPPC
jgi:hypothetical protein